MGTIVLSVKSIHSVMFGAMIFSRRVSCTGGARRMSTTLDRYAYTLRASTAEVRRNSVATTPESVILSLVMVFRRLRVHEAQFNDNK
jgi:hypothetical protein